MWQSLILIWACAGNPSALPWVNPDPLAAGCAADHWGYTDPVLDFRTAAECNAAGQILARQHPGLYSTWRCIADPHKKPYADKRG